MVYVSDVKTCFVYACALLSYVPDGCMCDVYDVYDVYVYVNTYCVV